jgi:DNA-binding XRE family transcriptional regulator
VNINKYFWDLNENAIRETAKILRNPAHPKYVQRAFTLLSRLDDPKRLFALMNKEQFITTWPEIRRYWSRVGQARDFLAWWDAIYKGVLRKKGIKPKFIGKPAKALVQIGKIIKKTRIEKGLSQSLLAQLTGMKQPHISDLEKGKKNVTMETLVSVCKTLGIKSMPVE